MKKFYFLTILLFIFSCTNDSEKVETNQSALASAQINSNMNSVDNEFIWDKDLEKSLSLQRASFAKNIVNAHKNNDILLGNTLLHTDILNNPACLADWNRRFMAKNIFSEKFAVQYIEAHDTNPLILTIRSKIPGREKFARIKFKLIVLENTKLVINEKCRNN